MNKEVRTLVDFLQTAVMSVYEEKRFLLHYEDENRTGLEQAFVFRVGLNFHELLKGTEYETLDLDSEYTKNQGRPKGLRPDLLLHERNCHDSNYLVVEFKGWWQNDIDNDLQKLSDLTSQYGDFKYAIGVFVYLNQEGPTYRYFMNGQEIETYE